MEPAVVRAKAGRPEDRPDLAAAEIDPDPRRLRHTRRLEAFRLADVDLVPVVVARSRAHSSKVSSRRFSLRSASANMFRSPPENSAEPSRMRRDAAHQLDPDRCQQRSGRASCRARRRAAATEGVAHGSDRRSRRTARPTRPTASIHHSTSRPRYLRGRRTCSPTASVTGRPERWISSASCTPVADAPTTSTPPSGSWEGSR